MNKPRGILSLLLKLTVLLVVASLVTPYIHLQVLSKALDHYDFITLSVLWLCMAARLSTQSYRMQYAAGISGSTAPFRKILCWEYEILFLEIVLPLPDSEDLLRIFLWRQVQPDLNKIVTALLFSRICGFLALALLLPFAAMAIGYPFYFPIAAYMIWLSPIGALLLLYVLYKILIWATRRFGHIAFIHQNISPIINKLSSNDISLTDYIAGLGLSIFQFMLIAGEFYILTRQSFGEVSFFQLFSVIPLVILAFVLPISLQGLGLPEAAMAWLLVRFGVTPETAAAIGIVHFSVYLSMIFVGAIIVLLFSQNPIPEIREIYKKRMRMSKS